MLGGSRFAMADPDRAGGLPNTERTGVGTDVGAGVGADVGADAGAGVCWQVQSCLMA